MFHSIRFALYPVGEGNTELTVLEPGPFVMSQRALMKLLSGW